MTGTVPLSASDRIYPRVRLNFLMNELNQIYSWEWHGVGQTLAKSATLRDAEKKKTFFYSFWHSPRDSQLFILELFWKIRTRTRATGVFFASRDQSWRSKFRAAGKFTKWQRGGWWCGGKVKAFCRIRTASSIFLDFLFAMCIQLCNLFRTLDHIFATGFDRETKSSSISHVVLDFIFRKKISKSGPKSSSICLNFCLMRKFGPG